MADAAVQKEKAGSFGADISAGDKSDTSKKGKKRAPPPKVGNSKSTDGAAISGLGLGSPEGPRLSGAVSTVKAGDPPGHSMGDIVKMLNVIQQNQSKQDEKIDKMGERVDEVYNSYGYSYAYDYDDYGESYEEQYDESVDEDSGEPAAKRQHSVTDEVSLDFNNKFVNAGKKLQIKESLDNCVDDHLAKLVNDWFQEGIEEDGYNDLVKKLTRPKNATALVVVKTNQMVWDFLSPMIRTGDKKLQNVQASIVKGAISLAKMANVMGQSENPEMSELLSTVMESLALFGHANRQLCMFRREAMKPDMKGEYSHLCSHNLKFTDYLFGDDVPKTVKDISDCSKISNRLGMRGSFRGRPAFRGRGRGRFQRGNRGGSQFAYGSKNFQKRSWTQSRAGK